MRSVNWPPVRPTDTEVLGVGAVLVASARVPAANERRLTELMFSSRNLLVELDEQTAFLGDGESSEVFGMTLHPGSSAYPNAGYTDQIALGMTIAAPAAFVVWQAKNWIEERQKNCSDAYNETMVKVIDKLRGPVSQDRLDAIGETFFEVLRKTLDHIDHDRMAPRFCQRLICAGGPQTVSFQPDAPSSRLKVPSPGRVGADRAAAPGGLRA